MRTKEQITEALKNGEYWSYDALITELLLDIRELLTKEIN